MRSAVAAQPHPVEALRDDHRRATRLMRLLTEQIDGLARLRPLDIEIAQGVFRYMVDFIDRQHHAREDLLIELLGKRDPSARRTARETDKDHDALKQEGAEILAILTELPEKSFILGKTLGRRLHHYAETLLTHFQHEETELFSLAEKLLSKEDWRHVERQGAASGDPLFGAEVEADFQALFDIYISQVREIGIPASRHATASAAAFVESTAAVVSGSQSLYSAWRTGIMRMLKANIAGAHAVAGSRSPIEMWVNALQWSRDAFEASNKMSRGVFEAAQATAHSAVEPLGNALGSGLREFGVSHRPDKDSPSWQSHVVNLALRATVKRMTSSASVDDFDIPQTNIEIPRTAIDRFIPALSSDVDVTRMELGDAFAEVISVKDQAASRTILFFPGGGFMMAPTQAHRLMAARLARGSEARVVLVHYRLAPEYRFPAGLDDCVEAYRYLLADGTPASSIAIVGDSAGGGMALSSLLRIRDEGLAPPAAAVLLSPVTDLSYSGDSRRHNSWADPSLTNDKRNLMARVYLGNVSNDDPLASPLFADLSGLPPILIQVGSIEILLDDALRVGAKIRAQGGDCECEVWHDMPHDWILFGMLPEARKALNRVVEFIDDKVVPQEHADPEVRQKA